MLLTDIHELKSVLEVKAGDRSEDKLLGFLIEQASSWIEEYLGRPGLEKKERTEYHRGTNTHLLPLRCRPVYATPTVQVYVDQGGYFGAASGAFASTTQLTYGTDFALQLDQEDSGLSRSALLIRVNDVWPKTTARRRGYLSPFLGDTPGSIKVVYTAGYTVDTLPAVVRNACNFLVARLRYSLPTGMELSNDSYEEKSHGFVAERKDYFLALVKPMLFGHRNWKW